MTLEQAQEKAKILSRQLGAAYIYRSSFTDKISVGTARITNRFWIPLEDWASGQRVKRHQ